MNDTGFSRCSNDDFNVKAAQIGVNPDTGQPVELGPGGVASVAAIQSALLTVSTALRNGHEPDFLEKVSLCLFGKLTNDPHALCPLFTICSMCLLMLTQQAGVTFDKDGNVVIAPPNMSVSLGPACIFDDDDDEEGDEDDGT